MENSVKLLNGNCLDVMKTMDAESVDSIVTDGPYGLSFMNKKWDYDVPSKEIWIEALRVLKPGGHLLAFGGTRTYHRLVVNIEDAGFEIRDQIQWLYGSGFPKSMDVSKQIDKAYCAEREVTQIGVTKSPDYSGKFDQGSSSNRERRDNPKTEVAKEWEGWGTALKPANEPICVARKPLEKGLTVAQNVLKWGTGAINIDESRISTSDNLNGGTYSKGATQERLSQVHGNGIDKEFIQPQGRWPANIILDETAAEMLDEQGWPHWSNGTGPSRFFYCAKASKSERNKGLDGMPLKNSPKYDGGEFQSASTSAKDRPQQNFHPTVKPIKLMEYLIKLVTPKSGTVLDPFMGSGSTGVAAKNLGFKFIGIELNPEYAEIAEKRIAN